MIIARLPVTSVGPKPVSKIGLSSLAEYVVASPPYKQDFILTNRPIFLDRSKLQIKVDHTNTFMSYEIYRN